MGALTVARAALFCAALGLLLPWHGLDGGLADLAAWPSGDAAPLPALLLTGARWWLWPVPILLALAALQAKPSPPVTPKACLRHDEGRGGEGFIAAGAGILAWVFLMGEAIGLQGLQWPVLAPLLGAPPPQPAKRDRELAAAIAAGVTLNCESEGEARRTFEIAERLGMTPRIAVRVNPSFELRGSGMKMGGGAKQFGVDQDRAAALAREIVAAGAEWRGWHIFTGSQALDAEALVETQANVLALADQLTAEVGHSLPKLNLGGGFGIPYFHGDRPLDLARVGDALAQRLDDLPETLSGAEMCVELGRYLVGEAGVYLTRVIDRKESHGQVFLVTDGGLHHQLAASGNFGTVVRRNYPLAVASRFYAPPAEEANVVGCLCTPLDRLADQAHLPRAEVGDLIAVFCAGAYGASASPLNFLGQGAAREMLV
ncbi:hypothetical protein J4558_17220 [Leptolyngbya sp. 15MV]|nr:hypothetical protein J4558_17220 [Leptolyngbya sp. 15MV]